MTGARISIFNDPDGVVSLADSVAGNGIAQDIAQDSLGSYNKLQLITRKSYGFRTQEAYEIALYHNLGALPEPISTHRFL